MTRRRSAGNAAARVATLLLLFALPLIAAGCPDDSGGSKDHPPRLTLERLSTAPETLVVSGAKIMAQASLWRDFLPPNTSGSDLRGVIDVVPVDPTFQPTLPSKLFVWVIRDKQVWVGALTHTGPGASGGQQYSMSGGPRLDPRGTVDVVVGIPSGKEPELLVDRAVTIMRTE